MQHACCERAHVVADLPPRFQRKISIDASGCWRWSGYIDRAGYGQVRFKRKITTPHRAVYEILHGPVADEDVDHLCRVRDCCNPAHVEPVSHRENMRRGNAPAGLNARKTHCKRGHEFTPENTRPHGKGNRSCKACEKFRGLGLHHPARTPMPAALRSNPLGLTHPAKTPMPERLRPTMGSRRVGVEKSPYAVRAERKGELTELVDFLRNVRAEVQDGATLVQLPGSAAKRLGYRDWTNNPWDAPDHDRELTAEAHLRPVDEYDLTIKKLLKVMPKSQRPCAGIGWFLGPALTALGEVVHRLGAQVQFSGSLDPLGPMRADSLPVERTEGGNLMWVSLTIMPSRRTS